MTFGQRAGLDVGFKVTGDIPRLAGRLQLATFRVLQEALNNARKHADARKAEGPGVTAPGRPLHLLRLCALLCTNPQRRESARNRNFRTFCLAGPMA